MLRRIFAPTDERSRRVLETTLGAALARAAGFGVSILTVRLALQDLGTSSFGVWMTISGVVAMLSFADLGLGNGLVTVIAAASGTHDRRRMAEAVSSATVLLSLIALGLLAVSLVAYFAAGRWLSATYGHNAIMVFAVLFFGFACSLPLSVVQRVQTGLQEGLALNLWQTVGTVLVGAGLVAVHLSGGGLVEYALVTTLLPLAALLLAWAATLTRHADLRPRMSHYSRATSRSLVGSGLHFVALQLAIAVAFASDAVIIARYMGPADVARYTVYSRLFNFALVVPQLLMAGLWAAYGEALARRDTTWAMRTLKRSLWMTAAITFVSCLPLVGFGGQIVELWTKGQVTAREPTLSALLAVWMLLSAVGAALAQFLNAANLVRLQVLCAVPLAVVALGLKLLLIKPLGLSGVVGASVLAYLLCNAIPIAVIAPRKIRELYGER